MNSVTAPDPLILKAVAHRPQDMLDIEAIVAKQPELDHERVQLWVQQFADLLEMPELWNDLEKILSIS
jgi:hypothetical protein